jgi:hypothetical protein
MGRFMPHTGSPPTISRRQLLRAMGAGAGCALLPTGLAFARPAQALQLASQDEAFLDEMERLGCLYFWEQTSPTDLPPQNSAIENWSSLVM